MSPRRRAPWTVLLVAAALLASAGAGAPEAGALPHSATTTSTPTTAATTTTATVVVTPEPRPANTAPQVPPLPLPPVPPVLPFTPAPARQQPGPPLTVPPLPPVPLPPVLTSPRRGPSLPVPSLAVPPSTRPEPGRPVLPGLVPPLGALPFPRSNRGLVASAGTLPVAGGPTDTRPGPGPSFTLEARSVTLNGARLRGLATPPGRRAPVREPVVRIDVDSATLTAPIIRALHADRGVVEARSQQTAQLSNRGQIYVEEITGTLTVAGLPTVPIRLAPGEVTTPGVDLGFLALPSLTLTDVTARVAFLGAGRLTIPGARFVASVPAA